MALVVVCFLAVICSLLHQGRAIACYQCNSHNDSRCLLDVLPDSLRKPCNIKDTVCRKISQVVEFTRDDMPPDSRVIRGCGGDESKFKDTCYYRGDLGGWQEVCSCMMDYCNGGVMQASTILLITIPVLGMMGIMNCF